MQLNHVINAIYSKLRRDGLLKTVFAIIKYVIFFNQRHKYHKMLKLQHHNKMLKYNKMLNLTSNKDKFTQIHQNNLWQSEESVSGVGSEIDYTKNLRAEIPKIVNQFSIKKMVDAPCGDFNWMQHLLSKTPIKYHGFDIVDGLVAENNKNFATDNIEFSVADICNDKLPDCDLLMVRDCLFHLCYDDINRFLSHLAQCDYKYLFTTTHIITSEQNFVNKDIVTGDFRLINLFEKPFIFAKDKVLHEVIDYIDGEPPRVMVLLAKQNVPTSLDR